MFDYVLCIALLFPALCLYDQWLQRGSGNRCITCRSCRRVEPGGSDSTNDVLDDVAAKPSLINRILVKFYAVLHVSRWGLLVAIAGAAVVCGIYAATLTLPESSDVRLLDTSNEYEANYAWRLNLLSSSLEKAGGSTGYIIWGVRAADTGDHNNPGMAISRRVV